MKERKNLRGEKSLRYKANKGNIFPYLNLVVKIRVSLNF